MLAEQPDHAQRMTTERERIAVAGRLLADAPDPGERLELVGERQHLPVADDGRASPAKRGW